VAKINQEEATRAAIVSRLRAGHTVRRIMSFEKIKNKNDINDIIKKFVRIFSLLEACL
jgi:hypothetical protein